ncbi:MULTISPECIES: SDR family NAD(P)-dependent oxidoreductase [unclassified Imperialibacter]|uniref:SDR family NAD(P)-dependent oxidoreductase n=1 Tax=unclassified Imperialibacter TaxID=2629706 RepID=UPI00125C2B21|nr:MULTISPECIES: SDR family oxidoreductase [unclassified Imperialibacter]CAD5257910.1 NAD(P)-dependent dehydrogenase, short-chain alcohol dehydrogenase family [Imperialibacter sp. 89]CAD5272920.1 NAD(P)-dependent dehydrogenase, short-chain alcohol dehydrogenase family [Imperialibacter sp. 75]VVT32495.1 NAD(P)-dependent dehydrogenase, short-chain alcohol dehydrogenase family [Imperialibacter sp. EC-SDR9]
MSDGNAKSYLVVGGSKGIGLEVVKKLLEMGHSVHSISRSQSPLSHANLVHHQLDVTIGDWSGVSLPQVLDGFVYCPGTINLKPFHRLTEADFNLDFIVNLIGAVKALQKAYLSLKTADKSSVVLFSTVAVSQGMGFHASVGAAKGAVEGLAKSLAAEWVSQGIRVNTIAPSLVDTPLAAGLLSSEDKRTAAEKRNPMGHVGTAQELAETVIHLLTSASWITGQVMHLDGGMSSIRPI